MRISTPSKRYMCAGCGFCSSAEGGGAQSCMPRTWRISARPFCQRAQNSTLGERLKRCRRPVVECLERLNILTTIARRGIAALIRQPCSIRSSASTQSRNTIQYRWARVFLLFLAISNNPPSYRKALMMASLSPCLTTLILFALSLPLRVQLSLES